MPANTHRSLDYLPAEILLLIAGCCDKKSHRCLFGTCRKLRGLLTCGAARLYRHICIAPIRDSVSDHLAALLRTTWLHPHIVTLAVHFTREQEAADALDLLHSLLGVLHVQSLSVYPRQAHRGSAARIQPKETLPLSSRGTTPVPFLALRDAAASPHIASLVAPGSTRVLSYYGNVHGYTFGLLSRRQPLTRDLTLRLERRFCTARGGAHVAASFPQVNTLTLLTQRGRKPRDMIPFLASLGPMKELSYLRLEYCVPTGKHGAYEGLEPRTGQAAGGSLLYMLFTMLPSLRHIVFFCRCHSVRTCAVPVKTDYINRDF